MTAIHAIRMGIASAATKQLTSGLYLALGVSQWWVTIRVECR